MNRNHGHGSTDPHPEHLRLRCRPSVWFGGLLITNCQGFTMFQAHPLATKWGSNYPHAKKLGSTC